MSADPGAVGEYCFAAEAMRNGLVVSWLSSNMLPFDFLVITEDMRVLKVQIKTSYTEKPNGGYYFSLKKHNRDAYTDDDVDFIICYAEPVDKYFVFPINVVSGKKSIHLYPLDPGRGKYAEYLERWDLMQE